jgi:hypothetical protein
MSEIQTKDSQAIHDYWARSPHKVAEDLKSVVHMPEYLHGVVKDARENGVDLAKVRELIKFDSEGLADPEARKRFPPALSQEDAQSIFTAIADDPKA